MPILLPSARSFANTLLVAVAYIRKFEEKVMNTEAPEINAQFVCIVDYRKVELAAIISSYIFQTKSYSPFFEFPAVNSKDYEPVDERHHENDLSRIRGQEFATFVNNVIARMGGCENLVLAGLSPEQKSYLRFLDKSNIIDIADISDVDFCLSPFCGEKQKLQCRSENILFGLYNAIKTNSILEINETVEIQEVQVEKGAGIVVVEKEPHVSTVIAVNFACSINANIAIIDRFAEEEKFDIQNKIEEWRNGKQDQYDYIENLINSRINTISFEQYAFATFFTIGIPYSLILKNCIPCSYVHIILRPDFFVINNLLFEKKHSFGSAVVFSPELFKHEETKALSFLLQNHNFFVKELFSKDATVLEFDMHLQQFPYDLFHICSHGGEIGGYLVEEDFIDRDGKTHTVVYDEVLSFSPSLRKGLIHVQAKHYYKKFDGFVWRSPELKQQNNPEYIYADMQNQMSISKAKDKKRIKKDRIANSCAVQCYDSTHQGMVSTLSSHTSPFIFNNTCWSWYMIAEPLLSSGAKGYIGTLWNVNNDDAIKFATKFYEYFSKETILSSFFKALGEIKSTSSEDIYIYWGLHFSTIEIPVNKIRSRINVFRELLRSYQIWKNKLSMSKNKKRIELVGDIITWLRYELSRTFRKDLEFLKFINRKSQ